MRLVVIGRAGAWHAERVAAVASRRGHAVEIVDWPRLGASLGGAENAGETFFPEAVDRADAVVVRGMPAGRLEEVILRMDLLARLEDRGTVVANSPKALETAIDKYLSLARLAAAGVPVPRTRVAQDAPAIRAAWETLGRDVVVKPLFGSCGRGMTRVCAEEGLTRILAGVAAEGTTTYLQEFIPHGGWDARILVLGREVFSMRRRSTSDWRTNLALGGAGEPFEPPPDWLDLARRAAAILAVEVAGVDLLPGRDGTPVVLEVNAVPGWRGLEGATGVDVTGAFVRWLESRVAGSAPACTAGPSFSP